MPFYLNFIFSLLSFSSGFEERQPLAAQIIAENFKFARKRHHGGAGQGLDLE
jgi:hypothetical protein